MIAQITPAEFSAWLSAHTPSPALPPLVLDVREMWEQNTASIRPDGFDLLGIPMNEIPQRLPELPTDRAIACLCHHGARSQRVAVFLAQNGFDTVANIAGGIDAWSGQRDALVPRY